MGNKNQNDFLSDEEQGKLQTDSIYQTELAKLYKQNLLLKVLIDDYCDALSEIEKKTPQEIKERIELKVKPLILMTFVIN